MAALTLKEEQPSRLVLETPLSRRLPSMVLLVVLLGIAVLWLVSVLRDPTGDPLQGLDNLGTLLILFAFFVLRSFSSALTSTSVTLDASSRQANRTVSIWVLPIRSAALPFDQIQQVRVGAPLPVTMQGVAGRAVWQITLDSPGGSSLVVNSNGMHDEMQALGAKVARLIGKPLTDELAQAAEAGQQAPVFRPIEDFSGGASPSYAPPVAAPVPLGRRSLPTKPAQNPPPNTLTPDSVSAEHARFEEQSAQAAATPQPISEMSGTAATADAGQPSMPSMPPLGMPGDTGQAAMPSMPPLGTPTESGGASFPSMPPLEAMGGIGASFTTPPLGGAGTGLEMTAPPATGSAPTDISTPAQLSRDAGSSQTRGSWQRPRTLEELQTAVQQDPTDSRAYYELARFWHAQRDYDRALEAYSRAIHLDPSFAPAQNDLGVLYLQRNKLREAEAAFRRASGLDPFFIITHYNLGLLLVRTGRRTQALQSFTRGLQSAGSDEERQLFLNAQQGMLVDPMLSPT